MEAQKMLTVQDVMATLCVSKSRAYSIMREMNEDLSSKGQRVIPGRISKAHFEAVYFGAPIANAIDGRYVGEE